MTDALYLADLGADPRPGGLVELGGDEGRHAAVVKRTRVGEQLLVALEYADTDRITHLSRTLGIDERKLAEASVRSIAWANQICSFIL